jgi:hypothetical protein
MLHHWVASMDSDTGKSLVRDRASRRASRDCSIRGRLPSYITQKSKPRAIRRVPSADAVELLSRVKIASTLACENDPGFAGPT